MSPGMIVICRKCGKGWIDDFTPETAHCPKCGNGGANVSSSSNGSWSDRK